MGAMTIAGRDRTISNVANMMQRTKTIQVYESGTQLVAGNDVARRFMQGCQTEAEREMQKLLDRKGADHYQGLIPWVREKEFKFVAKGEGLDKDSQVKFTVTAVMEKKAKPLVFKLNRQGYRVEARALDVLPPEFAYDAYKLVCLRRGEAGRINFVKQFVEDFIYEKPSKSNHWCSNWEPEDLKLYGKPKRNTWRLIARDWPMLLRFIPEEHRRSLGKNSHTTKGQMLTDYERTWIPTINQWLSTALLVGDDHKKQIPNVPGIYIQ